ncbi:MULTISPECIES: ATP-dependent endonuclease [unclassified Rhodococcus (in: high G+C Gram-positive bacteria)]|uniref:ATP-dependent nuclease n=1 Tax=unclassified Rhodococcus (in: high G+C Gram-positive bacteria) TaxID=192944 RepID=UPI0015C5BDF9|nr:MULTISPECIES: AAA family ATPase [unclassified Rhodococcus (in: high G+C Gram-positive bacteria)]
MLRSLTNHSLVSSVEERIAHNLSTISGGVREHHAFVGTQTVDDTYLARVFEMLLALMPDRGVARRLQTSSLGYVNLLHIAVTLAGIPDAGTAPPLVNSESPDDRVDAEASDTVPAGPADASAAARERLSETAEAADADADSFYPELFHATVLIEEPEAHLHPQLQFGLIRYLRRLVAERPDIQVIVTTHSADLVAACDPEDVVVVRKDADHRTVSRRVADVPLPTRLKNRMFQQTRLHLDATRSAALFADRVLIVEGVTEARLLRLLGRAWAGNDEARIGFVDSLAILPVGHKVGQWPIRMLATPGHELVDRVAAVADTDLRGDPLPEASPPAWHNELDSKSARFFWSRPTLEPSLVVGNERLVEQAFEISELDKPDRFTLAGIDDYFKEHPSRKGTFALVLALTLDQNMEAVSVPEHISEMFSWLYSGAGTGSAVEDEDVPGMGSTDAEAH